MALDKTISDLESEGYETITFNIPACAVNAQHQRQRIWIVAYSGYKGVYKQISVKSDEEVGIKQRGVVGNELSDRQKNKRTALADTNIKGPQGHRGLGECARELPFGTARPKSNPPPKGNTQSTVGVLASRLPIGLARYRPAGDEPNIPRLTTGDTNRVNKLRSLGNAIVPQVAYEILEKIAIIEQRTTQL